MSLANGDDSGQGLIWANDPKLRKLIYEYLTMLYSTKLAVEANMTELNITVRESFTLGREFHADLNHRGDTRLVVDVRRENASGQSWSEPLFMIFFTEAGAISVCYYVWTWTSGQRPNGRPVQRSTYHLRNEDFGYAHVDLEVLFKHFRDQIDNNNLIAQ